MSILTELFHNLQNGKMTPEQALSQAGTQTSAWFKQTVANAPAQIQTDITEAEGSVQALLPIAASLAQTEVAPGVATVVSTIEGGLEALGTAIFGKAAGAQLSKAEQATAQQVGNLLQNLLTGWLNQVGAGVAPGTPSSTPTPPAS